MKSLFCILGRHKFENTDGKGVTGEHKCKMCGKVIPAIEWPFYLDEKIEIIDVEFEEITDNGTK